MWYAEVIARDSTLLQFCTGAVIQRATLEPIVRRNPGLAQRLDEAIEVRRRMATEAQAAVDPSARSPKA